MAANTLGRNITFPIYNADGTAFHGLEMKKSTVESVVMSLGAKITGDVYYANNSLQVTMREYIVYDNVRYILVNPPTIIREGMVSENGELKGMTKYSFEFYHPMYVLGNFPFSDVAVSPDEKRYLSENKSFSWIGKPQDFIDKINKNLEGTEWIVVKSENFPVDTENELSDVLTFDNNTIADALKTGYETWGLPYIVDQIQEGEQGFSSEKKFKVIFGLPSNVIKDGQNEYVFRMGQGVGLKNNSRAPRNNKIVTRIAGYGSENNIPYGYPQIQWYGESDAKFTYGDHAGVYDNATIGGRTFAKFVSYPIYDGIVGGRYVKLIKHPFTRNHLMPSVYRQKLFNKVSPYLSDGSTNIDYNPDMELVDYYDANTDSYPNQINLSSPSYEIHAFEDVKPELGEAEIVGVQPINNDGTTAAGWDDTMDDDGNYLQKYFKLTLPQLDFDLYACAAITEEMQINMRSGACIGCTFPVQVDWEDYKNNFYDGNGNFAPSGSQRDLSKYPNSSQGSITIIVQKEYSTFGVLMPNIYQKPISGDEFVILGISLPDTYVVNAEDRLSNEMKSYMLANNIYYYDYPLKFDEYFLATHTNILSQIRTNTQVKFQFANEDPITLFVKQIVIKYGDNVLPQYDITLTDSVEVVLNQIGKVADDVEKLSALVSVLRQSYNRNVWGEIAKKLSKTSNDTAQGEITFVQGLKIGSNGNNGIEANGDATLNDTNVSGDLTITHVETPQGGEPIVKEYGITNGGNISGEGLTLGDYSEGLLGTGGVFKMIDGKSYLEADKLYVRMKAYFDTLEIRRYIHSGGNRVASAAGMKCSRVEWYSNDTAQGTPLDQTDPDNKALVKRFKCYFNKTDGDRTITNDFVLGDLAYCKTTNLAGSNQNAELNQKYYWRRVKGVGTTDTEHYIVLSNTDNEFDGTDFPEAEDDIVQLGNGNSNAHADRQGAIIEAVSPSGSCAPTYRVYQGIDSFDLDSKCKIDLGYNTSTNKAYLKILGHFYVGTNSTNNKDVFDSDSNADTYVRYRQDVNGSPLLEIKAKIDATSGSPILNTINSKAQVYTNTVGTMSSVAYKAGDLWILPESGGTTYAAGTVLVAKSDRGNSFNLNDWKAVEETEFNAYVAQIVGGGIVSSDPTVAQEAANKINAIKSALNDGTTTINGGLILTNLIALKNGAGGVTAGITGQQSGNDIALWLGGPMADSENPQTGQSSFAKSLFRFDGSGYLAGGNISWEDDGDTTVQGTVRADNLYHGVCFFHEELGADHYDAISTPHVDRFETPKHYINGVRHLSTGTCDVVFMLPANSDNPWNRNATTQEDANVEPDWPLDARTLTLPSPEDFDGKTIEVFIYSFGDLPEERREGHGEGYGIEKQIKIRSLKIGADGHPVIDRQTGVPVQYPVVVALGFDTNNGVPITRQEGENYIVSKDPSVGYLRFQAAMCHNSKVVNGETVSVNEYAWIMTTGMGGVNITNIEGDVIYSQGASVDWVKNWVMAYLMGAGEDDDNYQMPSSGWDEPPAIFGGYLTTPLQNSGIVQYLNADLLDGHHASDFVKPNDLQPYALTSALNSYLRLSGADVMTGNLKLGEGTAVKANDKDTDLLAYKNSTWGGVTGEHWFVGAAGVNGFIRSAGALKRWANNSDQYTIWDSSNLTPSNYLLSSAISDMATKTWVGQQGYITQATADGRYLSLTGGTMTGNLTLADSNGNSYGAIRAEKIGNDEYLYLWGNDGVLIDGLSVRKDSAIVPIEDVFLSLTGGTMEPGATITLQEIVDNIPVQTLVASQRWVNAQGFLTSADLSDYWNANTFKGVKVGNTPYSPQTSGTNAGWIDITDEFSSIDYAIDGKVSKNGDSMSGNLTMVGNSLLFKLTSGGSYDGAILASTVTPPGYQSAVGCITIGGNVNFDNDSAPPMVNGRWLATQEWADGRYLSLTGGTMTGNLTLDGGGLTMKSGPYVGVLTFSATDQRREMSIRAGVVSVYSDGEFIFNGGQVATETWVQQQGYLTSSALSGYATQSWVNGRGFASAQDLYDLGTLVTTDYLPLTAGSSHPLTGNIAYKGTKATYDMITFIDDPSSQWGNGIAIGGGGATIIGGGESAVTMIGQLPKVTVDGVEYINGGSEVMYIGNDTSVSIFTNLQNGWDYRKEFTFYNTGVLSTAGSVITPNGSGLYIEDTGGTERVAVFVNNINQFFVGYGMREAGYTGYFDSYVMHLRSGASGTTMTLDANNRVGIGTTDPGYKLDVNGEAKANYILFKNYNDGGNAGYCGRGGSATNQIQLMGYTGNTVAIGANSGVAMTIDTNNRVGIGTTAPDSKLHVVNECHFAGGAKFNNICIEVNNSIAASGRGSEINNYNGILHLQYNSSNNCTICTGGGNVGVGTSSPAYKLDVNEVIRSTVGFVARPLNGDYAGFNNEGITYMGASAPSAVKLMDFGYDSTNNIATVKFPVRPQVKVGTDWLEVVVAKSDENGIEFRGSEDGTYTFGNGNVRGDIYAGAGDFSGGVTIGNSSNVINLTVNGRARFGNYVGIGTEPNTAYALDIDGSVRAFSFVNGSDIRMKDIVSYMLPSVHDIASAPIIEFTWKKGDGSKNVGSIAQYWEKVFPQAVHADGSGMLSMEYGNIALASAITVARHSLDNERRIAELELRVAELESIIENYEINNNNINN